MQKICFSQKNIHNLHTAANRLLNCTSLFFILASVFVINMKVNFSYINTDLKTEIYVVLMFMTNEHRCCGNYLEINYYSIMLCV
jgi:hypothetical protein